MGFLVGDVEGARLATGEEGLKVGAAIMANVSKKNVRPISIAAVQGFAATFCPKFPEVESVDGHRWLAAEQGSFERFKRLLSPKPKALGAGASDTLLLRELDERDLLLLFDALRDAAWLARFPVQWRRLIFVLIPKKVLSDRVDKKREIGLADQLFKIFESVFIKPAHDLVEGRLVKAQYGNIKGGGCGEAAAGVQCEKDCAFLLRHPLVMSMKDLEKFFPRSQHEVIHVLETRIGIPADVLRVTVALFEDMVGAYESVHGLTEWTPFPTVFQGGTTSPSRCRLLMNSLAEAIKLRAVGVDTWSGHFADGRTIKQYMFADDECGLSLDMCAARDEIFMACVWAVIHGHRLGIDGINKTAVGAVEFTSSRDKYGTSLPSSKHTFFDKTGLRGEPSAGSNSTAPTAVLLIPSMPSRCP